VTAEYRKDNYIGTNMEREQTMQQILRILAEMNAKMDAKLAKEVTQEEKLKAMQEKADAEKKKRPRRTKGNDG
jgi:hypothetical protein